MKKTFKKGPHSQFPIVLEGEFNLRDFVFGSLLFLPLFLMINGSNISLPDSYYNPSGFPLHLGMLFFFFFLFEIKFTRLQICLMIFALIYNVLWLFDPTRAAFILQSYLFLFYFFMHRIVLQMMSR